MNFVLKRSTKKFVGVLVNILNVHNTAIVVSTSIPNMEYQMSVKANLKFKYLDLARAHYAIFGGGPGRF